jgi:hypothetical protein
VFTLRSTKEERKENAEVNPENMEREPKNLRSGAFKATLIGVFLTRIPGYTQENDHFLSVYSFIRIRSTNSPSTWKGYSFVFG